MENMIKDNPQEIPDSLNLQKLIKNKHTKGIELPISLIQYLIKGQVTCAVTGKPGTHRDMVIKAIAKDCMSLYPIRVLCAMPELPIERPYSNRKVLSIQNTDIDIEMYKPIKINIAPDMNTPNCAVDMIRFAQKTSECIVFSHPAESTTDLVLTLRDAISKENSISICNAEKQVTDIVKIDIHLSYSVIGERYIERITEIVPAERTTTNDELDISFTERDIIRYDLIDRKYYVVNKLSHKLQSYIKSNIGNLIFEYDEFINKYWN